MNVSKNLVLIMTASIICQPICADPPTPKKPIDEEEARAFCEEFAERFLEGDGPWLSDHIDIAGMAWRATNGKSDEVSKRVRNASSKRTNGVSKEVQSLIEKSNDFESYNLKWLRKTDDTWKALLRLNEKSGDLQFYEVELARKVNGEIGISEFYNYLNGETLTESLRTNWQSVEDFANRTQNENHTEAGARLNELTKSIEKKEYRTAIDLYAKLPNNLKESRFALKLRLLAASHLDDATYESALADYSMKFPTKPPNDFAHVITFFQRKKYDDANATIDRIMDRAGPDAYLYLMKANVLHLAGKSDQAIEAAKEGMRLEKDVQTLYLVTLNISLQIKNHQLTRQMIEAYESRFGIEFEDFTTIAEYAEFIKSTEYKAYMQEKTRNAK